MGDWERYLCGCGRKAPPTHRVEPCSPPGETDHGVSRSVGDGCREQSRPGALLSPSRETAIVQLRSLDHECSEPGRISRRITAPDGIGARRNIATSTTHSRSSPRPTWRQFVPTFSTGGIRRSTAPGRPRPPAAVLADRNAGQLRVQSQSHVWHGEGLSMADPGHVVDPTVSIPDPILTVERSVAA